MMQHKMLFCLFVLSIFLNSDILAQDFIQVINIPTSCSLIEEYEYEMLDYSIPKSAEGDLQAPQIVEEYGVFYNLIQMPVGYEIPTELKVFAVENGIDGVAIVQNYASDPDGVIAEIIRTIDKKIVLIVTDNVTQYPEAIAKILMGITYSQEVQSRELRSIVKVNEKERGWRAGFAKMVGKGIEKVTNVKTGTKIDFNKISIEESGSFSELFGEDKVTLTVRGQGPYAIEIKEIKNVISSVENITAYLVFKVLFKDENVPYTGDLYIGDDGRLYNCHI